MYVAGVGTFHSARAGVIVHQLGCCEMREKVNWVVAFTKQEKYSLAIVPLPATSCMLARDDTKLYISGSS